MALINAQTVYDVNAETGNEPRKNGRMPKEPVHKPSAFWKRLEDALGEKWAPLNANSLAKRLGMSQGSVYRWFRGEGLPELDTALDLAKEGSVCVDWLLNAVKPKHPISKDPLLRELFEVCEELDESGRQTVLRAAKGELLQKQAAEIAAAQERSRRA